MSYLISHIATILSAETAVADDTVITQLLLDSRKVYNARASLFFALKSQRRNGHQFIAELYKKGVRNFVVCEAQLTDVYPGANFLLVEDTLAALQQLAAYHRRQFSIPVIGITGSNGKTIVKEWLYQLLHDDYNIVRSPKSYNSQIGVPLSVWQMNEQHTLAIFEAGISQQGEMLRLEKMICPTIGVLSNIGEAHSDGFIDSDHKFREKLSLFKNSDILIGKEVDFLHRTGAREALEMMGGSLQLLTWGEGGGINKFVVRHIKKNENSTLIFIDESNIEIPFTDDASIENAITCYCILRELRIDPKIIAQRIKLLQPVNMRLELKKGINHCAIINDSYSADLSSLEIALNFLEQQSISGKRTVILSDFLQTATADEELYRQIATTLSVHKVNRLIGIGEKITAAFENRKDKTAFGFTTQFYPSTDEFEKQFRSTSFKEETILIKGARLFAFERIVQLLEQKVHQTVLEINLNAIAHNLKEYQQQLNPSTKIMGMVKAFAYGSGGAEIAGILQYHNVDYLGVAYADEGVELRKAGITLPIMVMNPEESAFEAIVENNLEPELYSFEMLQLFEKFIESEGLLQYPIHIEIETGMNRLGFSTDEVKQLAEQLSKINCIKVESVFTHLAASEEEAQDEFTLHQFTLFQSAVTQLKEALPYSFLTHIANSAAAIRHPQLQLDMVRLGIGLYGVDSAASGKLNLQTVATLKSTIAQLKQLKKGESVSYNRKGIVEKDSIIATVRLGYADGYPRRLGNSIGKVWIKGKLVRVIGTICMDMFMVDVTDVPDAQEGDEVIIFGQQLPVQQVAEWAVTIPYEIMTGISQRVKRVYFEE